MIIGICGEIGSGKSTATDHLIEYGFKPLSFGKALKDGVAATFGWPRDLLEGDTKESREFRETVDKHWSAVMGRRITPRIILQEYGTEVMRKLFHEDFWIERVRKEIEPDTNYVISDVRFPNEKKMIREYGGDVWVIYREQYPVYHPDKHVSETAWIEPPHKFDNVLDNSGSKEELYKQIDQYMKRRNRNDIFRQWVSQMWGYPLQLLRNF